MIVTKMYLKNWRNFRSVEVQLGPRVFLVGPNASGKSNFLDAFRFLRDVAQREGGGLQQAVRVRGGMTKIRSLAARTDPNVALGITLEHGNDKYEYQIEFKQEKSGKKRVLIENEIVKKNDKVITKRPNKNDKHDDELLTQSHIEQISANQDFREITNYLDEITYYHLVPQLLRYSSEYSGPGVKGDPFGREFLRKLSLVNQKGRDSRLKKISDLLKKVVPQLGDLRFILDEKDVGRPHLQVRYTHWRPQGSYQNEADLSDGTLRLISLLWLLGEGNSLLLLEEPELSLHPAIVRTLPGLMAAALRKRGGTRQVIVSTHSTEMLNSEQIGPEETIVLIPEHEQTRMARLSDDPHAQAFLDAGLTVADIAAPLTAPGDLENLLFEP